MSGSREVAQGEYCRSIMGFDFPKFSNVFALVDVCKQRFSV